MASFSKTMLLGNVGSEPDIRTTKTGVKVANFSLATNKSKLVNGEWKKETEWHRIILWKNLAEKAEKSLRKGMLAFVEGEIHTNKWTDKDGQERTKTEINANTLQIIPSSNTGRSVPDSAGTSIPHSSPPNQVPNQAPNQTPLKGVYSQYKEKVSQKYTPDVQNPVDSPDDSFGPPDESPF